MARSPERRAGEYWILIVAVCPVQRLEHDHGSDKESVQN
ncbi:hypothetical protein J108_18405 [Mycobacteroides abscessus subsp. bolletii CRM-0020]|uniref:Uncharacterized protein n=2 Tax=Mycobacteroides abscessus TaxID=36809 RepID=A0A829HRD4_9MYCO|nr:hypothetical protein MYCMA_05250 [Mycobacteroides abscessus subsp. massiliense str. GO 06]EIU78146.1 hypothetical protein MM2B0626_3766 [Mycobacteroides abscessus subsp. bolletii 2B-0626]EPQ22439.1 hypothetical protein J108_18405 [Mycobacteroides abscessus subsp. bolletii CRM-0020]ESV56723.1 hypothetical protein L830_2549 [Mycobacteroides abscessus MAB_082312_2258]ESV65120.1 hypothetical protein L833_2508 [Mycobacteroides abscessus MAB_091912_2446]